MHIKRLDMKFNYDNNMLIIVFFVAYYINPSIDNNTNQHMILISDVCLLFVTHNYLYINGSTCNIQIIILVFVEIVSHQELL